MPSLRKSSGPSFATALLGCMALAACNALTGVNDLEIVSGSGGSEHDASAGSAGSSMGGSAGQGGGSVGGADHGGAAGSATGGAGPGGAAGQAGTGGGGAGGCDTGWADCDGTGGCETAINVNDNGNCGACDVECVSHNASSNTCTAGACTPTCLIGYASCDGDGVNGCETRTLTDPANCGSCGASCELRQYCTSNSCMACVPGKWDCNQSDADGCEKDCLVGCDGPNACGKVLAVAAGGSHACAILSGGLLACWGAGTHGQLGDGLTQVSSKPKKILDSGVTQVGAGINFTCVIVAGDVKCWGNNDKQQLGYAGSAIIEARKAKPVVSNATLLAVGSFQAACAAVNTGKVFCWGEHYGPTPVEISGVASPTAIAVGTEHACAVVGTGVKCWGKNGAGQFGNGTTSADFVLAAVDVTSASDSWTLIGAGDFHSLGGPPGSPLGWGGNNDDQLGVGDQQDHSLPTAIKNLLAAGETVVELRGGHRHSCAIVRTGGMQRVKCWGRNEGGRLGLGATLNPSPPVKVTWTGIDLTAIALSVGWEFACAIMPSGDKVACWGHGESGQLGDGYTYSSGSGDAKLVNFAYGPVIP